jgi:hypothetical protein
LEGISKMVARRLRTGFYRAAAELNWLAGLEIIVT